MVRMERRTWLLCVSLTWLGSLIAAAGAVLGIWLQFVFPHPQGTTFLRLEFVLEALPAVATGLLVVLAAQILAAFAPMTDLPHDV